ncbi:MAG: VanZ family protein [Bacteroidetes bacterium]|nr:VanZ family protein [Bacteroidota bacterium]
MKIRAKAVHISLVSFCVLIFAESSIPGNKLPKVDFEFSDKIVHTIIYFILYILFFYSLKYQTKSVKLQRFSFEFAFLFTVLYGVTDEFHQYFVPNRSCEFYDLLADAAGAAIGLLSVKYFLNKRIIVTVLIAGFFLTGCSSSGDEQVKEVQKKVNAYITEADCWIDNMPMVNKTGGALRFLISVNIESESRTEKYEVRNFNIILDNDTLLSQPFDESVFETVKGVTKINISPEKDFEYLNNIKKDPEYSEFRFDIYRGNKKTASVNSGKIKILKTY